MPAAPGPTGGAPRRLLLHGRVQPAALRPGRVPAAAADAVRARDRRARAAGPAPRQAQPARVRVRGAQAAAPAGSAGRGAAAHLRRRVRAGRADTVVLARGWAGPGGLAFGLQCVAVGRARGVSRTRDVSWPGKRRRHAGSSTSGARRRDNPASDVRGANAAGGPWRSVLVRTGVFHGAGNDAGAPPPRCGQVLAGLLLRSGRSHNATRSLSHGDTVRCARRPGALRGGRRAAGRGCHHGGRG